MSTERRTETIPQWKREEVSELTDLIGQFESVGIVDITGIPARQLQDMRANLYGSAEIRMSRNTLIERALREAGKDDLVDYVEGHVGLVGTDENPFALFRTLEESKTPAPINAGEVAPNDIVIPEGDTGMDPGPFVGDLQQVGAAAQIMDGSIKVTEDSVVAEEGDVVSDDLAGVLAELGIEPKEVGLDLRAVFADGVLFEPGELELDIEAYEADLRSGAGAGRNLSVNAAYPTARTAGAIVAAANADARGLGLAAAIESPDLAGDLLARADARLRALAAAIDDEDALPEELRDVGTPSAEGDEAAGDADAGSGAEDDSDAEEDAAEGEDEDDDEDDGDGGDALGAMFG